MAQIIAFNLAKQKEQAEISAATNMAVQAAWQFAYAALWQEQVFPAKETERAQQQVKELFAGCKEIKMTFLNFCERIVLANRFLSAEPSRYLPNPSIWFNKNFPHGYAATKADYHTMQGQRLTIPEYQQGSNTLALHYWQYINTPSLKTFSECRKKLLQLKEYGLIQLFYNSIIYYQFTQQAI